ncbi:MAG: hypothetical protein HUU54_00090 [Ignavibacteriaceae bacterium]|nr:hypothetical protein [Ignavibacteriaceae bacterium]
MMFEKEIRFIVDFNINKIKRLGAFFTINDLINSDVHPAIVQYISAELNYLLHLDRKKILKESVFDYSGKEISSYFEKIADIIRANKLLPFEDVKRLVEQAVIYNLNFVIRPRWTLKRFVYDNEETRTLDDLRLFFRYGHYYPYYANILVAYFEKKSALEVSASEFESSLYKIENELIRSQQRTIIDETLKAISDFVNIGEGNKKLIAIGMVEMTLKEKGLQEYINKLRTLLSDDPKQKYEVEDYKTAIYSGIAFGSENNLFQQPVRPETQPDSSMTEPLPSIKKGLFGSFMTNNLDSAPDPETYIPASETDNSELEQLELLLNSKLNIFRDKEDDETGEENTNDQNRGGVGTLELFDEDVMRSLTVDEKKQSPDIADEVTPVIKKVDSEMTNEFRAEEDESEEQDPGILSQFSTRETMRVVSTIFSNDSMDFVNTMEKINDCRDRDSALSLINTVFLSYKINAFSSPEASLLIQKIEKHFAEKSKG